MINRSTEENKFALLTVFILLTMLLYYGLENEVLAENLESASRGEYLTNISACGSCHASELNPNVLSGGREIQLPDGTTVYASNITPSVATGIGDWNIEDISRAFKSGISRDKTELSFSVHSQYRWMADKDASDISTFLLTQKPVKNVVVNPDHEEHDPDAWNILNSRPIVKGYIPIVSSAPLPHTGFYLTTVVAGCTRCHSEEGVDPLDESFLAGTDIPKATPNIRNQFGGKPWSYKAFDAFLERENQGLYSCPTEYFKFLSEDDRKSIVLFLNTLDG